MMNYHISGSSLKIGTQARNNPSQASGQDRRSAEIFEYDFTR